MMLHSQKHRFSEHAAGQMPLVPAKMRKAKLRDHLIFVFILVVSLFLVAIVLWSYLAKIKSALDTTLNQNMSELAHINALAIQKEINGHFDTLNGIASGLSSDLLADKQRLLVTFEAAIEHTMFERLGLIYPNGLGIAVDCLHGALPDTHCVNGASINRAMQGSNVITNPFKDSCSGNSNVAMYVPVYLNGSIVAVLCGTHNADVLRDLLEVSVFDGNGYVHLIDSDGNMLFRSTKADLAPREPNIFHDEYLTSNGFDELKTNLKTGTSGVVNFTQPGGVPKCVRYTPVGINDWFIGLVMTTSYLNEQNSVTRTASFGLVGFIVAVIIAMMLLIILLRQRSRNAVLHFAMTDPLTGCGNRSSFLTKMQARQEYFNGTYDLVTYNLRKFRFFNELFGHEQGDALIKKISEIFSATLANDELFARLHSDQFLLLLNHTGHTTTSERLHTWIDQISKTFSDRKSQYEILSQCGVYHLTEKDIGKDLNVLIDYSNEAMEGDRSKKKNTVTVFDLEIAANIQYKYTMERLMHAALLTQEFMVYLQPKYCILDEPPVLAGAEALARWQSKELGMIYPDAFIPLFEENGFIIKLDMYMLDRVCAQQQAWLASGMTCVPISVNMSRLNLYNSDFMKTVQEIIDRHGVPYDLIELEITESAVFNDQAVIIDILTRLHELGIHLSIDDFGCGYSSFNMLTGIDVDTVKIDKGFFDDALQTVKGKKVVSSLIWVLKGLGFTTVAEGIETAEEVAFLKKCGCDLVQGYYFGKPAPIDQYGRTHLASLQNHV
ncbi:MAG: EAL domain-containing protein [Clostridia bacterium]